uniref:Uncharacterized protein n=1 Tax=Arundo donax TaxID=35708 RepID=A0A0A9EZY3_ARUDO
MTSSHSYYSVPAKMTVYDSCSSSEASVGMHLVALACMAVVWSSSSSPVTAIP